MGRLKRMTDDHDHPAMHLKMYKPAKVLSQFVFTHRKRRNRTLLGEYINAFAGCGCGNIMAIGRLDEDSEGLLLLTTDGKTSARVRQKTVEKEYWVQVDGRISDEAIERLKRGVEIHLPVSLSSPSSLSKVDQNGESFMTYTTLPCTVRRLETKMVQIIKRTVAKAGDENAIIAGRKRKFKGECNKCGNQGHKSRECAENPVIHNTRQSPNNAVSFIAAALPPDILPSSRLATRDEARHGPTSWISITITEGKNRQIRKMTAAIGHPTLRLVRVRIGPIVLEGMVEGEVRAIEQSEIDAIR